jgi:methylenetetrahydrofolate reductase (NADPH)
VRISEAFKLGRPLFSFEFLPPKTDQAARDLFKTIDHLQALRPDFVTVTYHAGGSTRERTIELVTEIKHRLRIEVAAHLTCVGHTAEEIAAIGRRLRTNGIENLMALRGDPPRGEAHFVQAEGGFGHASELIAFLRREFDFCLGAAAYPEKHLEAPSLDDDLRWTREKVGSGAAFLTTQLFFEAETYFAFVRRARAAGIRVPILPGIMPVTNVAQFERFSKMGATIPAALRERLAHVDGDDKAVVRVGVEWATEQAEALLAGGAPGIHFYTLNRSFATREIFTRLKAERAPVRRS